MTFEAFKGAGVSIHVAATGAGAGIQHELWSTPGASAFLSGASFPYAAAETAEFLGFDPEHACSPSTAIDLASAAYMKAYRYGGKKPVGVGLTAAVPTDRERKGEDRFHVCVITDELVLTGGTSFVRGSLSRASSDAICATFAIELLKRAVLENRGLNHLSENATDAAVERFFERPFFSKTGERSPMMPAGNLALMPGAFDPPHEGHFGIAAEVEREHHLPVVFQITADAPHKPHLTVQQLLKRAKLLKGRDVLFTRGDALYIQKARRCPETPFVIGSDALDRMLDPKWGPDPKSMLVEFAQLGTSFYVSPRGNRGVDDCFDRWGIDCEFKHLFTELRGSYEISSTQVRASR